MLVIVISFYSLLSLPAGLETELRLSVLGVRLLLEHAA